MLEVVVGGVVVHSDGDILLARSPKWEDKYVIFGGHVHSGERLDDAMRREIKEEVGIEVAHVERLNFDEFVNDDGFERQAHMIFINYACFYGGGKDSVELNDEYSGEYIWVSPQKALEMRDDLGGGTEYVIREYLKVKQMGDALDNWKRAVAEFENYKKSKMNLERDMAGRAVEDFAYRLLPVVDNFHMSTDHIPEDQKDGAWVQGIMYIQKQLEQVLAESGIEEIAVKEGDVFDPNFHEAVETTDNQRQTTDDAEDGENRRGESEYSPESEDGRGDGLSSPETIKKVLMRGYRRGERVLRPARVTVQ